METELLTPRGSMQGSVKAGKVCENQAASLSTPDWCPWQRATAGASGKVTLVLQHITDQLCNTPCPLPDLTGVIVP